MSKDKISRKDLKENELEHALVEARDYVVSHEAGAKKWTVIAVAAVVLVGLVWGGLALRSRRLDARLSAALSVFDAPLVADGAGAPPGVTVYKDGGADSPREAARWRTRPGEAGSRVDRLGSRGPLLSRRRGGCGTGEGGDRHGEGLPRIG